jgi:hypothetical protein
MVNKQGEMKMKALDYYSTVPMAHPKREDYKKVFVYSKGKTIINGMARSQINDTVMKGYRDNGFIIEESFDKDAYYAETRKYAELQNKLLQEFKLDLFAENGVSAHPKAEAAYNIASNERSGLGEIRDLFEDIAALLR